MENEVIALLNRDQIVMDVGNPIQVSIGQFYGLEINDFAVTVARTALRHCTQGLEFSAAENRREHRGGKRPAHGLGKRHPET